MNNLEKLFIDGKLNFADFGEGVEWTFTSVGDYGILPGVAENVAANGIEPLAEKINALIKADVAIGNLEVGLTSAAELGGRGVRGDRELFMRLHQAAPFTRLFFCQ